MSFFRNALASKRGQTLPAVEGRFNAVRLPDDEVILDVRINADGAREWISVNVAELDKMFASSLPANATARLPAQAYQTILTRATELGYRQYVEAWRNEGLI